MAALKPQIYEPSQDALALSRLVFFIPTARPCHRRHNVSRIDAFVAGFILVVVANIPEVRGALTILTLFSWKGRSW